MQAFYPIRYKGVMTPRPDPILRRSGRDFVRGQIYRIPVEEAYLYLAHPQMFEITSVQMLHHEVVESANAPASVETLSAICGLLTQDKLKTLIDELQEMHATTSADSDRLEREDHVGAAVNLENADECAAYERRLKDIAEGIRRMPETPDNFDRKSGRPLLKSAKRFCRHTDITPKELDAAWNLVQKSK